MCTKKWDIDQLLHCPIIGMCLTMSEQRQMLRKVGLDVKHMSAYAIHCKLIEETLENSLLARRVDKTLNRKYRKEIAEWRDRLPDEWQTVWEHYLKQGDMGTLLWLATTYKKGLSEETLVTIYGDIHMLMYTRLQQHWGMVKRFTRVEEEVGILQKKYFALRKQLKHERKALQRVEKENNIYLQKIRTLSAENEELEHNQQAVLLQVENEVLQNRLGKVAEKLQNRTAAVEQSKNEKNRLKERLAEQNTLIKDMQAEIEKLLFENKCAERRESECSACELCNRKVLFVGGMTKLRSFYRQLVTKMGGVFEYHDGYKYDGDATLSHLIGRSDVILCPVDVNSHAACLHVKKYCKKWDKPYYMLHSSSVSTVYRTLTEVADAYCN